MDTSINLLVCCILFKEEKNTYICKKQKQKKNNTFASILIEKTVSVIPKNLKLLTTLPP